MCCLNSVLVILLSISLCCCLQNEFRGPDFGPGFDPDFDGEFPPPYFHHGEPDMNMMHHHHDFDPYLEPSPDPPDALYPVKHAGLPLDLAVNPLPLADSDHELTFNVSWHPAHGPPARDYSIEIDSITETDDCRSSICYEYDIPGGATWWLVPKYPSPLAGACAIRPGCAYLVRLIAHPWDGHTAANLHVELDECVAGVCSCGHYINLPVPVVKARTVSINGDIFVNITWTTPPPKEPKRLPPGLKKKRYAVSVAKQTITDVFANTVTRYVDTDGPVADGDITRYLVIPISERSIEQRNGPRDQRRMIKPRTLVLDVRLMARVKLIDDRGCVGPEGSATAYDPVEASKVSYGTYILWALFGGACIAVMCALIAASARVVKRILNAFRPAPVSAPATSSRRPAWFPLQIRTNDEIPVRGQMENSPLYVHKEFEVENCDEWEVSRCRVHLGALIGSGAFGRVHIATLDMPGGETLTVAAKMLSEDATEEESQDFLREIVMLKHVGVHKHVIRLIGCCTQRSPLMALLEHAPRGDLLSLLRAARGRRKVLQGSDVTRRADSGDTDAGNGRPSEGETEYTNFSDSDPALSDGKLDVDYKKNRDHYVAEPALRLDGSMMREYALQVALGMRHLEERGITHRDLAARNILVDGAGTLKVADFGLSRSGIYVHTRSRPVPLRWLAPEAILYSQYCSASDVWAFAVLLWEIATLGGFPYAELSNHQVPPFLAGGGRLPKPARASPRLYQLMVECWSETPDTRPSFKEIVEKLQVQQQLYVDLETLQSDDAFSDFDFNAVETN